MNDQLTNTTLQVRWPLGLASKVASFRLQQAFSRCRYKYYKQKIPHSGATGITTMPCNTLITKGPGTRKWLEGDEKKARMATEGTEEARRSTMRPMAINQTD